MNIRPKILKAQTGVKFSAGNENGKNWRAQVFDNYRKTILDYLRKYGQDDTYGNWLNNMQSNHAQLYKAAGDNWQNIAYKSNLVGNYQNAYKGFVNNGKYVPLAEDQEDFNRLGISAAQNLNRYNISGPTRTSGDYSRTGHNYDVDNLYSAITDDRRLLGRIGDFTDQELEEWNNQLREVGWQTVLDPTDNYYKLQRIQNPAAENKTQSKQNFSVGNNPLEVGVTIPDPPSEEELKRRGIGQQAYIPSEKNKYGLDWSKIKEGAQKLLNNPDLYSLGRLAYTLHSNDKIYGEAEKAIKPNLIDSYNTYRQVVGDEATKQAYYRRAAEGVTKASRPMTSDADRQMAYQMEAQRAANELRAQGDLADNQMIQKTSDESNQHQWANTQRDNQVANANRAAMNDANARLHNLRAQHKSADAASINNFWQEIEYRKRQQLAEDQNFNDQIWQYGLQEKMYQDENLMNAQRKLQEVKKAHTDESGYVDITDPDVIKAKKEYDIAYNNFMVRMYRERYNQRRNNSIFVKKGGKVTYKKKDDLLYRSAKDIVEHFRKMTKLAYDSVSKRPKEIKLISHPKGSTKKYQQGGVAPFLVYTPVALGGETTTASGGSTSSTKKSSSEELGQDLLKDLFKQLQANGLPSDVNAIYSRIGNLLQQQEFFGNALSTDDIQSIYVSTMQQINTIKFNKAQYDKAQELVINRDAGDEVALTADGKVVVQNRDTAELDFKKIDEVDRKKESVLTNNDLLNIRAYSPSAALNSSLLTITNNATSLNEISKYLKAQLPSIGSSERTIEGYSQKDSNDIKQGIELLAGAPNGLYKISEYSKSQKDQANKALQYLYTILPNNMKNLLAVHTGGQEGAIELIATMIGSTTSDNNRINITAVTGKASDKNGSSSGDNDMIPAVAFFQGLGDNETFIIQDKTSDGIRINTVSQPITLNNKNTGSITFDKLASSDFGGQLRMGQATMGDALIASNGRNNIIIGERIYQTELPIDQQAASHGVIKPDLSFLKNIEKANEQLRNLGIDKNNPDDVAKNIDKINQVYKDNQLPILYTTDGNKPIITSSYARFAMVNATATRNAFEEDPNFNDGVREATDQERKQFESSMKQLGGDSKYKLNNGYLGGLIGGDELYTGIIYIPMSTSTISALGGTGYKAKGEEYNQIEAAQQAANAAIQLGFKSAGDFSSHN